MFQAPASYDEKSVGKSWKEDDVKNLLLLREQLAACSEIIPEETEQAVHQWIMDNGLSMGRLMNSLRLAVIGISQGPSIFAICGFIGKEETLRRIDYAVANIK